MKRYSGLLSDSNMLGSNYLEEDDNGSWCRYAEHMAFKQRLLQVAIDSEVSSERADDAGRLARAVRELAGVTTAPAQSAAPHRCTNACHWHECPGQLPAAPEPSAAEVFHATLHDKETELNQARDRIRELELSMKSRATMSEMFETAPQLSAELMAAESQLAAVRGVLKEAPDTDDPDPDELEGIADALNSIHRLLSPPSPSAAKEKP